MTESTVGVNQVAQRLVLSFEELAAVSATRSMTQGNQSLTAILKTLGKYNPIDQWRSKTCKRAGYPLALR